MFHKTKKSLNHPGKLKGSTIRNYLLLILILVSFSLEAQQSPVKDNNHKVVWHGYTQLRFATNFENTSNFSMRRLKFWIKSSPEFNRHLGFQVQATLSGKKTEKFMLQNVLVFYRFNHFKLNLGQFIPEYSLQRFQPDYVVPLTERATVINTLIPDAKLGVRDLGAQLGWQSTNHKIQSWLGVFNGYGIKTYRLNNSGIMITNKTEFHFANHFKAGYSVMFRKAKQLKLINILPDSVTFSGNDFRYNLFAEFQTKKFQVQAEYLAAFLNHSLADGYYILAVYNFRKNQFAASWNQYDDLINSTQNNPEIHLDYNYLFKKNKIKLMADNGFQIDKGSVCHYMATIQFQLFFK